MPREIRLKDPKALPLIKSYLTKIIYDYGGIIHSKDLHTHFSAVAKTPLRGYFIEGKKIPVKNLLSFVLGSNITTKDSHGGFEVRYIDPNAPRPSTSGATASDQVARNELVTLIPPKSRMSCEKDLQQVVDKAKGDSKDSAIQIDDPDEEAGKDFSELMKDDYGDLPLINYHEIVTNFKPYYTYQEIHVAYVRLRLAAFFESNKIERFTDKTLHQIFKTVYRENFFHKEVLQYFVTSKVEGEDGAPIPTDNNKVLINKFLKRFCGDFFEQENQIITLKEDAKDLHAKCYEALCSILDKVKKVTFQEQLSQNPHISVIGKFADPIENIDVVASNNFNKTRQPWFNFPTISIGSQNVFPTIDELNERVKFIRRRICQEGRAIKIVDIINDLCHYYRVPNLQAIRVQGMSFQLKRESEIPAIFEIMKTQGKMNAFIHAFVTFHNICTMYELHEELCKFSNKSTFEDFKLGPFQQQLLIYDQFQFPPDKTSIPTITTKDVFQLLWKLQRKQYQERQNAAKLTVSLQEFMEFLMAEYGFESPFESGVKIGSIGLAISAVKKAWFSNYHYLKDISNSFHQSICSDMKSLVSKGARDINESLRINPTTTYNPYTKALLGMPVIEAFLQIFRMVKNIKQQVNEKLPGQYTLMEFGNILSDVLVLIKSDATLTTMFHVIMATAPLRALGKNDISVLKCLGFNNAIKEIILEEERLAAARMMNAPIEKRKFINKGLLLETVKRWLEKNQTLDLHELYKMEQQIIRQLNAEVSSFEDLGHGSFLKFVSSEEELYSLLNCQISNAISSSAAFGVPQHCLHDFVSQCDNKIFEDNLINGIIDQFRLGQQSKNSILTCVRQVEKDSSQKFPVIYEKALTIENSNQQTSNWEMRAIATHVIASAPIMANIEKWSNWERIYHVKIGSIGDLLREGNLPKSMQDFHFLEVSTNHHIKVKKDCTIEELLDALQAWDTVMTCNCLISIIISCGGVHHTPLTLISSHFQNVFMKEEHMIESDDASSLVFTLKCFTLIPFRILSSIAMKVFISNLSMTHGSINVSELLLNNCRNLEERYILHALGMHILNPLWIGDMKKLHDIAEQPAEIKTCEMDVDSGQPKEKSTSEEKSADTQIDEEMGPKDEADEQDVEDKSEKVLEVEDKKVEEESNVDPCFSLIENIRRQQFGIGVDMGDEQQKLIEVHRAREGRSLQRLSKELYSTDSHFALELIQNADDNHYDFDNLNEGEEPTVAFILHADKIVVLNNETGFMNEHIRALCDVGKSTKGIHRKGYIGQKGIGFKSVFRITDCPEIHSNGFHIKFDATEGPNGYILPTWIEEGETLDLQTYSTLFDRKFNWMTKIILPLKKEMPINRLIARFYDVHPSLLMFLNQLQNIIIADEFSGKMNVMKKKLIEKNILEVSQNDMSQLWFIVSKEVSLKVKDQVKETDVALAFPIGQKDLHPQPVFAYLPLRSYGFKFIIQADFEIPSSREDVYKDNSWNQCILQNIPALVMDSFREFKNHSYFNGIDGILEFFKFMDIEEHVLGVFQPVAKQVIKNLQKENCLPIADPAAPAANIMNTENSTESNEKKDYKWSIPSKIIFSKAKLEQTISPYVLHTHLGMNYLHSRAQTKLSQSTLMSLGVKSISLDQLLHVAVNYIEQNNPALDHYKWLSRWFLTVYEILQDLCDFTAASLNKIRKSPVFPLNNGKLIKLEENIIFLPIPSSAKTTRSAQNDCMEIIRQDLNILSYELIENIRDSIEQKQFVHFLNMLGLKQQNPKQLIDDYIYPIFKSEEWKEKGEVLLVACVKYLFYQYINKSHCVSISDLKSLLILKTSKGMKKLSDNLIYIPKFYGNTLDLDNQLPSGDWLMVSQVYGQGSTLNDIEKLYRFWEDLGLKKSFTVQLRKKILSRKELESSPWSKEMETWPSTDDNTYVVSDLIVPEFFLILDNGEMNEIIALSEAVNNQWEIDFARYNLTAKNCIVADTEGKEICKTYSSLILKMQSASWILSHAPSFQQQLHHPADLFVKSSDFYSVFAEKVTYLSSRYTNENFVTALGVTTNLTQEIFMDKFKHWILEEGFMSTYDHILNIYKYMSTFPIDFFNKSDKNQCKKSDKNADKVSDQNADEISDETADKVSTKTADKISEEIADKVSNENTDVSYQNLDKSSEALLRKQIIFLPSETSKKESNRGKDMVIGSFWPCSEVYWSDPSGALLKIKKSQYKIKVLDQFYPNSEIIKSFFLSTLEILKQPSFEEYLDRLEEFTPTIFLPDKEECLKVYNILVVLGESLLASEFERSFDGLNYPESLDDQLNFYDSLGKFVGDYAQSVIKRSNILQRKIFPTNQNRFTKLSVKPLLCFNKHLARPFSTDPYVDLIYANDIHRFLKTRRYGTSRYVESSERKLIWLLLLFKACEVTTLTSVYLEPEIITENLEKGCITWEKTLHNLFPVIQCYIKSRLPGLYHELCNTIEDEGTFKEYLFNSVVFLANTLEVVYRLKDRSNINVTQPKTCAIEEYGSRALIYIQKGRVDNQFEDILKEILIIFVKNNEPRREELLEFLLDYMAVKDKEYFLRRKRICVIKFENEIWNYPKPIEEIEIPKEAPKETSAAQTPTTESKTPTTANKTTSSTNQISSWPPKKPRNFRDNDDASDKTKTDLAKQWERPPSPDTVNKERLEKDKIQKDEEKASMKRKAPEEETEDEAQPSPKKVRTEKEEGEISDDDEEMDDSSASKTKEKENSKENESNLKEKETSKDQEKEGNVDNSESGEKDTTEVDKTGDVTMKESEDSAKEKELSRSRPFDPSKLPVYDLDMEYEDLPLSNVVSIPMYEHRRRHNKDDDNKLYQVVGSLGEQIVYKHLKKFHENEIENKELEIEWLNAENETGEPYDMKLIFESGKTIYVEVKTSLGGGRKEFEISFQQIKFALQHGESFHLYRVTGVSRPELLKIKRLKNLATYLDKKAVKLFMVL